MYSIFYHFGQLVWCYCYSGYHQILKAVFTHLIQAGDIALIMVVFSAAVIVYSVPAVI